jgi:hypothetical protein
MTGTIAQECTVFAGYCLYCVNYNVVTVLDCNLLRSVQFLQYLTRGCVSRAWLDKKLHTW